MVKENTGSRRETARRVFEMRKVERGHGVLSNRSGDEYIESLLGVQHLLHYASSLAVLDGLGRVIDLGAGSTKAIKQIALTYGDGLSFEATVLRANPLIKKYLGCDATHITMFETLRGVRPGFVGALSVFGLGYAPNPEASIDKLDNILVPGAFIKSNFMHPDQMTDKLEFITHDRFSTRLIQLGYDVAIADNLKEETQVMLAVKLPVVGNMDARTLLSMDMEDCSDQQRQLVNVLFHHKKADGNKIHAG